MTRKLAITLDEETLQRLSFISEAASMADHRLAEEAVRIYTREKERYIKDVQQGQDDIRDGRTISHKALVEELESRLADLD